MTVKLRRELYTKDYYCFNNSFFKEFKVGKVIPRVLKRAFGKGTTDTGIKVLDIGCGCGDLVYHLSKFAKRIYGLDYSENALQFSKETIAGLPENIKKKICLLCAQGSQLPFKNNAIDCIFSLEVFEHLTTDELKLLVKEIYRVLKETGRFIVFTSPNKEFVDIGYKYWIKPINKIFNPLSKIIFKKDLMLVDHYSDPTHINFHTVKSLKHLFLNQGFKYSIYTSWFLPDNLLGYIYKIMSTLWPISLFRPLRNLFCAFLWVEGEK